jgi:cation transport ATPase
METEIQDNKDGQNISQDGPPAFATSDLDGAIEKTPTERELLQQVVELQKQVQLQQLSQQAQQRSSLGGLIFYIVVFTIMAVSFVGLFFGSLLAYDGDISVQNLVFAPIVVILGIWAVINIISRKHSARRLTYGVLGSYITWAIVENIAGYIKATSHTGDLYYSPSSDSYALIAMLTGITTSGILVGVLFLLFAKSERFKEVLINT